MKSSVKVDFRGLDGQTGFEPVIRVDLVKDPEDVRDSLLKSFFESLGGKSSWLRVEFLESYDVENGNGRILISPVKHDELELLVTEVQERIS